ncbi:hypothetical protein SAMN05519103_09211 [Rhizobiales bacterium GAS113]|nr:hypothetical protein SAMN05519103_09211 [Rhizobiales bacterium GAS113]
MRILTLALTLALASCIAPYQPPVLSSGAEARQIRRDTWRIFVRGPDFPSAAVAQDFVLLQAAQTTLARGTHLIVLSPAVGFSTAEPTVASNIATPGEGLVIRIITVRPGKPAPAGAINADRLAQIVRARLGKD